MRVTIFDFSENGSSKMEQFDADSLDGYSASSEGMDVFLGLLKDGRLVREIPMGKIGHVKFYLEARNE